MLLWWVTTSIWDCGWKFLKRGPVALTSGESERRRVVVITGVGFLKLAGN